MIYNWLPSNLKIHDPVNLWSSDKHGYSLKAFIRKVQDIVNDPMLMLIETTERKVFGCYTNQLLHISKKFYGTSDCFLF